MRSSRKIASIVLFPAVVLSVGLVPALRAMGQQHKDGPPKVVHKSSEALLNSVVSRIAPVYPAWAPHTDSSTAVIKVVVSEDGSTLSAAQVLGDRLVGWSAIQALRRWRWAPTVVDGAPARVLGLLAFTLAGNGSVTAGPAGVIERPGTEGRTDYLFLSPYAIALFKQEGEEDKRFEEAPEVPLRINDSNEQPLFVEHAMVRAAKAEPLTAQAGYSLMRVIFVLRNSTNNRVTSSKVRFTNWQAHTSFLIGVWSAKSDSQDHYAKIISEMSVPGDPAGFEVEVESVQFEGGDSWISNKPAPGAALYAEGSAPAAPSPSLTPSPAPGTAPRTPSPGAISPPTIPVPGEIHPPTLTLPGPPPATIDSRPKPLSNPRPNYTEEARRNGVMGISRVRVLVGADGSVKRVKILTGLPDGLTEEAIRAAYQIKFKPAKKDGKPVEFWQAVEIEFNLR